MYYTIDQCCGTGFLLLVNQMNRGVFLPAASKSGFAFVYLSTPNVSTLKASGGSQIPTQAERLGTQIDTGAY